MDHSKRGPDQTEHARHIVEQVRRAQEVRGMSNAELARRSRIPEKRLGRLMRFERVMRSDECVRLCYVLELNMGWLMPADLQRELSQSGKDDPGGEGAARRGRART